MLEILPALTNSFASIIHSDTSILCFRRWQDDEPHDEVLRVVAKPILLPPLLSYNHQHRGTRVSHANRRTCSQDDCPQVQLSSRPFVKNLLL